MARPTKSVRVMVAEASGCWANAVRAVATERPSPSAGIMQPMLVVKPAVMIEVIAIMVELSMVYMMGVEVGVQEAEAGSGLTLGFRVRTAAAM